MQIDAALEKHSDPFYVDIDNVGNVSYDPKAHQLCFEYKKGSEDFGELLNIGGTSSKTLYGPKNIHQPDEIERLLDFAEAFRVKLEQRGYKLDKWKRQNLCGHHIYEKVFEMSQNCDISRVKNQRPVTFL